MNKKQPNGRVKGISANALVMPIVLALAVLHIMIIVVIIMINSASNSLSAIMKNSSKYTQEATSILAGSSLLSETASNYILMPETGNNEVNVGPLQAYAAELDEPRRGYQVLERFREYDVTEEEKALIEEAAGCANAMMEAQLHAISLVNAVYPIPQVPPLISLPLVELTEEEQNMPDEKKLAAARTLVLGQVYGLNKSTVSVDINACQAMIQSRSGEWAAEVSRRISILRILLWVTTSTIILILIVTFAALYKQILFPLGQFVKQIPEDTSLDEQTGFREVRMVAAAYNDVLTRRDALDSILRSAAETDALTNLPNRYRFEQYLLESGDSGYSMALLLFDVNYLKKTNDTHGHLAGDNLIRTAADCISTCFGENCFRFGGDEFAAIIKDCTPDSIEQRVAHFEKLEKEQNVSISLGYAYAREIGDTSFKALLNEADQKMYEQKKKKHAMDYTTLF